MYMYINFIHTSRHITVSSVVNEINKPSSNSSWDSVLDCPWEMHEFKSSIYDRTFKKFYMSASYKKINQI